MSNQYLRLLCLFIVLAVGCKKKNKEDVQIMLNTPAASGNNILLSWEPSTNELLQGYLVYRISDTANKGAAEVFAVDRNTTTFTDTGAPAPYIQYYVAAQVGGNATAQSNKQVYRYDNINFLYLTPKGVLVDKDSSEAYVYSSNGDIALYDLNSRMLIRKLSTNSTIGFCCLGVYEGHQELYVPRTDGYLSILDAQTLEQVDEVNVGAPLYSVSYHNGTLFIAEENGGYILAAYDRTTGRRLSLVYNSDKQRSVVLPGTNTAIASISTYGSINRYLYDDKEGFVDRSSSGMPVGYPLIWYTNMELFPGSSKMIVSAEGIILKETGAYDNRLTRNGQLFNSFDIDLVNQHVYASCTAKVVNTYALADYKLQNSTVTRGYPVKVFSYDGKLFSISTSKPIIKGNSLETMGMYTFIEQL